MKRFSFTMLLTFFVMLSFGQEHKILIGIDAGPSLVSIRNKDNNDLKSKIGFAAGLSFEYLISEAIGIKSGLLYDKKGAKDEINYIDAEGRPSGMQDIDIQIDYLVVPVLFAFHIPGKISYYANAGPYFGILLKNMVYYDENDQYQGLKEDFTSETNGLDFGLSFGIGTNIEISDKMIFGLDIKNNLGLSETIAPSKNNSLGLLLGLKYRL